MSCLWYDLCYKGRARKTRQRKASEEINGETIQVPLNEPKDSDLSILKIKLITNNKQKINRHNFGKVEFC